MTAEARVSGSIRTLCTDILLVTQFLLPDCITVTLLKLDWAYLTAFCEQFKANFVYTADHLA